MVLVLSLACYFLWPYQTLVQVVSSPLWVGSQQFFCPCSCSTWFSFLFLFFFFNNFHSIASFTLAKWLINRKKSESELPACKNKTSQPPKAVIKRAFKYHQRISWQHDQVINGILLSPISTCISKTLSRKALNWWPVLSIGKRTH